MAVLLTPQRKVLAMADSQIGYSRWKDDQQGTKYARETQPVFWPKDLWLLANGISFCDLWITWIFWMALGKDFVTSGALPAGASYNTDYRASKGGRISKSQAQPGDVLVFDWNWATLSTNHVGILEKKLASGNFQTIEGNTSPGASGSQGNGGGVYRRVRRPDQVRYVLRPDWSKATASGGSSSGSAGSAGKHWTTSTRIQSMTTAEVRTIQQHLVDAGYDISGWGVDGSYGDATGAAVKQLQHDLDLTADGVWGPATQEAYMTIKTDLDYIKARLDTKLSHVEQRTPGNVLDEPIKLAGTNAGQTSNLRTKAAWEAHNFTQIHQQLAALQGELADVLQALRAVDSGDPFDLEQVRAAAQEGVSQALDSLEVTVSKGD